MNPRIVYLRNDAGVPVGCVAMKFLPESGIVRYQISVQNPIDKFNRSLARTIALGRLDVNWYSASCQDPCASVHKYTYVVMQHIVSHSKSYPKRAVKAAKQWINFVDSIWSDDEEEV